MTQQEQDVQTLKQAQSGEARALAELYDRYTPLLYPVALRILQAPADAEDAIQDTWLQVWRRLAAYDPQRGTLAAWLLTVVRTRSLDRYRSRASRSRPESRVDPEPVQRPADPLVSAVRSQLGAKVREALATLAPQQRQAIEIAYFEGLSQSEVAARLKAPLGTIKSWTRQGLTKLRELSPQGERT